jgi:hypothetical protein
MVSFSRITMLVSEIWGFQLSVGGIADGFTEIFHC